MRKSFVIIFFVLHSTAILSQKGFISRDILPWYQNVGFVHDSIESVNYSFTTGLFLGIEEGLVNKMRLNSASIFVDSNSYSEANFIIGNQAENPNQSIGIDLIRPINERGVFEFRFKRTSNAGWIDYSFFRENRGIVKLNYMVSDRWSLSTNIRGRSRNIETNFGIIDSTQFSILQNGPDLGLAANTRGSTALLRLGGLNGTVVATYEVSEIQRLKTWITLPVGAHYTRFMFRDGNTDSLVYESLGANAINSVNDSTVLFGTLVEPGIQGVFRIDSIKSLKFKSSVKQEWFLIANNGLRRPFNQSYRQFVSVNGSRLNIEANGQYFTSGYNSGDNNWRLTTDYKLWERKSTGDSLETDMIKKGSRSVSFNASIFGYNNRPGLIYTDYRSDFRNISNSLSNVRFNQYKLGLRYFSDQLDLGLSGQYEVIDNFTYFDRFSVVNQINRNTEVYRIGMDIRYAVKWLSISSSVIRQISNDIESHVPMPEWINYSSIQNHWPLFSNKLRLSYGVRSIYYTGYFARGVNPVLNILYVQNTHNFGDFLQVDAFTNINIRSVEVGIYLQNALYGVTNDNPLIAPHYVIMPRNLMLNINWKFKN